eukprot:Rmarinus@m.160
MSDWKRFCTVLADVPKSWNAKGITPPLKTELSSKQLQRVPNFSVVSIGTASDSKEIKEAKKEKKKSKKQETVAVTDVCLSFNGAFNCFRSVDSSLAQFKHLRELDLSTNFVSSLSGLSSLEELRVLNLSENRLQSLRSMPKLKQLVELDVSLNLLESTDGVQSVQNLTTLKCAGNRIIYLKGVDSLQGLQHLNLHENEVEDTAPLAVLPALESLQLSSNSLKNLQEVYQHLQLLPNLRELCLYDNPISEDPLYRAACLDLPQVERLDHMAVGDNFRKYISQWRSTAQVSDLINATSSHYMSRIEDEKKKMKSGMNLLRRKQEQLLEGYQTYEHELQRELNECIEFLSSLVRQGAISRVQCDAMVEEMREEIRKANVDRDKMLHERHEAEKMEQFSVAHAEALATPINERLLFIAQKRPDIWREMKRFELYLRAKEEESLSSAVEHDHETVTAARRDVQKYLPEDLQRFLSRLEGDARKAAEAQRLNQAAEYIQRCFRRSRMKRRLREIFEEAEASKISSSGPADASSASAKKKPKKRESRVRFADEADGNEKADDQKETKIGLKKPKSLRKKEESAQEGAKDKSKKDKKSKDGTAKDDDLGDKKALPSDEAADPKKRKKKLKPPPLSTVAEISEHD